MGGGCKMGRKVRIKEENQNVLQSGFTEEGDKFH